MDLPFILSNKDWEELKPPGIVVLGEDPNLDPQQKEFLKFFRVVDQRAEWSCRQAVVTRNAVVVLAVAFVALLGPQLHTWLFK